MIENNDMDKRFKHRELNFTEVDEKLKKQTISRKRVERINRG